MKKKNIITILIWLIIPNLVFATTISFGNPAGTEGDITSFFEAVLGGILNIIAFLAILSLVIAGVTYIMAATSGNDSLVETAKKIITGSIIGVAIGLAGPTFMKEIKEIVLDGGSMPTDLDAAPSLTDIVSNILSFLLSVTGILAIISLVVNSFLYLIAGGDSSKADKAKTGINWSIIGLIVVGSALIIVEQIALLIEG